MERRRFLTAVGGVAVLGGCSERVVERSDVESGDEAGTEDVHAGHDWPTEPDPETAPEYDGEFPPGIDAAGMKDPEQFIRFHDVAVSQFRYVSATANHLYEYADDRGNITDEDRYTVTTYADIGDERCYAGYERYKLYATPNRVYRKTEEETWEGPNRAHVTRRALDGLYPYTYLNVRWESVDQHASGELTLHGTQRNPDIPDLFGEELIRGFSEGDLQINADGLITGWTITNGGRREYEGETRGYRGTIETSVTYGDQTVPEHLPEGKPEWAR